MFRCAASSLIAYPLLRGAIPCVSVAVPIPAVPIHCFVFRCCAIPMLCVATPYSSTLCPSHAILSLSVAPCLLALRILCWSRRILAFPMRLLPCFAIPMHFSASPVPAMPKLFRTWRIHCLALPHLSIPLLLTSVLFRCDSLRFGAFPTLFGVYPLLSSAMPMLFYACLCLCISLQGFSSAMLL